MGSFLFMSVFIAPKMPEMLQNQILVCLFPACGDRIPNQTIHRLPTRLRLRLQFNFPEFPHETHTLAKVARFGDVMKLSGAECGLTRMRCDTDKLEAMHSRNMK